MGPRLLASRSRLWSNRMPRRLLPPPFRWVSIRGLLSLHAHPNKKPTGGHGPAVGAALPYDLFQRPTGLADGLRLKELPLPASRDAPQRFGSPVLFSEVRPMEPFPYRGYRIASSVSRADCLTQRRLFRIRRSV